MSMRINFMAAACSCCWLIASQRTVDVQYIYDSGAVLSREANVMLLPRALILWLVCDCTVMGACFASHGMLLLLLICRAGISLGLVDANLDRFCSNKTTIIWSKLLLMTISSLFLIDIVCLLEATIMTCGCSYSCDALSEGGFFWRDCIVFDWSWCCELELV